MRISYAIPVCNELEEIQNLTQYLLKHKSEEDEIIVLIDQHNFTPGVRDYIETFAEECEDQNVFRAYHALNKDFANHKNYLNSLCSGEWILQLDADEYPDDYLMEAIPWMINQNPDVEAYWLSRINTVKGITDEHISKWNWQVNNKGWVNFPDPQLRLYKNSNEIKWEGKVHERLIGYKKFAHMPSNPEYCLHHPKSIERQERQNAFYDTI
jgi:cellulose synthase/poly-beta-1,6-N-acetylglucosamine synthase-like glycosyltransferase